MSRPRAAVFEPVAARLLRNGETRSAPAPDRPRDAAARTGAHGTDIAHAVDDGLAARGRVGWRDLRLGDGGVRLARPGMGVTLNGIAQGWAAERVRGVLAAHGIRHALVDAGEYAMVGRNPAGAPWTLGIADPRAQGRLVARLFADGRCVATSGDDQTAFSADRRHHHIFDPRTGYSPPDIAGVTVAAPSGALADALTKVFFVAGPERALAVARRWNVDALWIDKSGRRGATPGLSLGAA